jgi:hypothetical protein
MTAIEDEREALAKTVYYWDVSENVGSATWERLLDGQRDVWRSAADVIIAAGFRRQRPITDDMIEEARTARALALHAGRGWEEAMRSALEAARDAS